jgi:archaellum biogenesis ATPase FlaH
MVLMSKQNLDYGYDVQRVYLEMMLTDAATFVRCQAVFDPNSFDRKLQPAAQFITDYVNNHNVLPTFDMVNSHSKTDLKDPGQLQEQHYDWLLIEFETFARHKALEAAILKSADLLERGEYGPVEELVKRAVQIGLQKDLGTDYWSDPRARLEAIKNRNGQVSTGWAELDNKLFGGFNRGELNIFAGGSGAGKSLFLANLGVNWALIGLNVLYLTFELSENLVSMRVDSMITGISSRDVFKNIDDVEIKVRMIGKKSGAFQVKYMPSGKNANDIRSYVKEYEIKTGRKVDVLLIDYLDLMMPLGIKISPSDLYVKDKYVSEELRNLAMEMNTVFVTASQLNRCLTLDTLIEIKHRGKIAIKDVEVGDEILTDNGYNTVVNKFPITQQKVYQIKTKSGKIIRCSAEHIFPTSKGEKKISSGLSVGDVLYRKR